MADYTREEIARLAAIKKRINGKMESLGSSPENEQGFLGDAVDAVQHGLLSGAADLTDGVGYLTGSDTIRKGANYLRGQADNQINQMSPDGREAFQGFGIQADESSPTGYGFKDESSLKGFGLNVLSGVGSFAPTMVPGLGAAKAISVAGKATGLAGKGTKAATALDKGADVVGFAGAGAASIGGSTGNQAYETVVNADFHTLKDAEIFQKEYWNLRKLKELDHISALKQARENVARELATEAAKDGAIMGAITQGALGPVMGKLFRGEAGSIGKAAATGAITEGSQEFVESGGQTAISNMAVNPAVPTNTMDNVVGDALTGAMVGGPVGGGFGAAGASFGRFRKPKDNTDDPLDLSEQDQGYQAVERQIAEIEGLMVENGDNLTDSEFAELEAKRNELLQRRAEITGEQPMDFSGPVESQVQPEQLALPNQNIIYGERPEPSQEQIQARQKNQAAFEGQFGEPRNTGREGEYLGQVFPESANQQQGGNVYDGEVLRDPLSLEAPQQAGDVPALEDAGIIYGEKPESNARPARSNGLTDPYTAPQPSRKNDNPIYQEIKHKQRLLEEQEQSVTEEAAPQLNQQAVPEAPLEKSAPQNEVLVSESKNVTELPAVESSPVTQPPLEGIVAEQEQPSSAELPTEGSEPIKQALDKAAQDTNTQPTEKQIEADNYKKGRVSLHGLDIAIENPKDSVRSGKDSDGKKWESKMAHHYGDIKGIKGADGDDLDVFIGDKPESDKAYIVDQVDPKTGEFDEHKVMLGFDDKAQAESGYLKNYEDGWKGVGAVTEMPISEFKEWIKSGDTTKPVSELMGGKADKVIEAEPAELPPVTVKLSLSNKPFKTESSARLSRTFKDTPNAEVVPVDGGFGVKEGEVAKQNAEPATAKVNVDESDEPPYAHYHSVQKNLFDGKEVTADEVKQGFERLAGDPARAKAELNKLTKKELAKIVNGHVYSDEKKARLVERAYQSSISRYRFIGNNKGSFTSHSIKLDGVIDETRKHLNSLSNESLKDYGAHLREQQAERQKKFNEYKERLTNPKTIKDFQDSIATLGKGRLSDEQLAQYDKLLAEKEMTDKPAVKQGLESDEKIELGEPEESTHGKTGDTIFNVKAITRIGKEKFKEAANFARSLGGGYYRSNFYFKSREDAGLFSNWMNGEDVDLTEKKQARDQAKKESAASRLKSMADSLEQQANERLNSERKENTIKRMREADSARNAANNDIETARLLKAIADNPKSVLKNLTQKVQVELFQQLQKSLVHYAPSELKQKTPDGYDHFRGDVSSEKKAQLVKMPLAELHQNLVDDIAKKSEGKKGFILLSRMLAKKSKQSERGKVIPLDQREIEGIIKFYEANKEDFQYSFLKNNVEDYKRLKRMGITSKPALRAALLEFMNIEKKVDKPETGKSKLEVMQRNLKQRVLGNRNAFNDFFPTPTETASEIIDLADIQPGMKVLEPSAGNGLLADAAKEVGAKVDTVEMAGQLREILSEKGYRLVGDDFLEYSGGIGEYDRIVMNPPFSNDQDIQHVAHAYDKLKPGGRLVAIVSRMAGERQNKRNKAFSQWLDDLGAETQALPENAFKSSLNPTAVRTKAIIIDKPEDGSINVPEEVKPPKEALMSISERAASGMKAEDIRKAVEPLIKQLHEENTFQVVQSVNDLPFAVRLLVKKQLSKSKGENATVRGVNAGAKNYLIADGIKDEKEAVSIFLHEVVGHKAVLDMLGKEGDSIMERIAYSYGPKQLQDLIKAYGADFKTKEGRILLGKEKVAQMAERNEKPSLLGKLVANVKAWLRNYFPNIKWSDNDVLNMLATARDNVENRYMVKVDLDSAESKSDSTEKEANLSIRAKNKTEPTEETPYDTLYRTLGQKDKTVFQKAKDEMKRQFKAGGLLPDSVFSKKIERDSNMNASELDVSAYLSSFRAAVKKAYGKEYSDLNDTLKQKINNQMSSTDPDKTIPFSVRLELMKMRFSIKGLSQEYAAILKSDMEQLRNEGKDTAANEKAQLLETILGNLDTYTNRSYKAFDDPKWPKKVPQNILDDAKNYLESRYLDQGLSEKQIQEKVARTIRTILEEGTAYEDMGSFIKESKLGAKDLSTLKKRKEIAPEIRALLGEYQDVEVNFAKTVTKTSHLVANHKFLQHVRDLGEKEGFLFTEENKPLDKSVVKIAADGSEVMAPLNGFYTYPEIEQAFREALGKQGDMPAWLSGIIRLNGIVKYGKTVLSPTTAMRNIWSAFFFSVANGHFDVSQMRKSIEVRKQYFGGDNDKSKLAYLKKLKSLGVIYDTPYAGEMMDLLEDSRLRDFMTNKKVFSSFTKLNDFAQKFYQYGDDMWKIMGWENEKAMLMKYKKMSEPDAEVAAAERIRNTYPTYSMTGRFTQSLRRFPLAGTFVSFPAEIIRTSYHMIRYLKQDFKESPAYARRKVAGLALVSSLAFAAQGVSKALMGLDDDEEEAVRDMAASWQKNSNILFTGRDENGNIQYLDMSFLDPYNYFKRPINAMLRDQPIKDMVAQSASEMLTPFFGEDITFSNLMEVYTNKKGSGGKVFNEQGSVGDQAMDIADHLRKGLQPGFMSNMERMYKAMEGDVSASGKKYTVQDEMAALVGFRMSTLDPKTALYYQSFDFKQSKADAAKILKDVLRNPNKVSKSDLENARDTMLKARKNSYDRMMRLVKSAKKAGMTNPEIGQILKLSGVSRQDVMSLILGRMPKNDSYLEMAASISKRAEVLYGKESGNEIISRAKGL